MPSLRAAAVKLCCSTTVMNSTTPSHGKIVSIAQ
jgi:hypothetical protein